MSRKTVLLVGAGAVGRAFANYLTCYHSVERLVVADKDENRARSVAANSEICAHFLGNCPMVEAKTLDLDDEDATVKLLEQTSPEVALNATTMIPLWIYTPLVKRRIAELGIEGYYPGHTLAKDLLLTHKLMKAVKRSRLPMKVVNASFPDNTHPVLAKVGLSPTVGAGNVDNLAMGIRKVVADKMRIPAHNLSVTMVSHHAISLNWVDPNKVPYYLKIRVGEVDLTSRFDSRSLIMEANNLPVNDEQMAAISSVRQVISILEDRGEIILSSGVGGIPGCVPARLDRRGAEIVLPDDLTMDKVLEMNQAGMRFDGIEKVEEDGTAVFTDSAAEFMRTALGINWVRMRLSEAEAMTKDLAEAYNRLSLRFSH